MAGIKFLISGFECSGKSTLASKLNDSLVINFDKKEYGFKVPHVNLKDYTGLSETIAIINDKIKAYKDKFSKLPKFIVFDTLTQFYTSMSGFNSKKYTGFNIHSQNNSDTIEFNNYIENVLIPNGISVIAIAHTMIDSDTGRFIIPAQGQFAKNGSWLSIVNDSIFIDKSSGKLVVHFKGLKYPARTTLELPEKVSMEEYDINEHLDKLINSKIEAAEYIL